MKKLLIIYLGFLSIPALAQEEDLSLPGYNLDACLKYAIENSQVLQNSAFDMDKSKAQIGEIRAIGLPQVNANLQMNYNFEIRKTLLPASTFAAPGDTSVPADAEVELAFGTTYDGDFAFQASQLIFDGSYFVGLQAAKTYRELSTKQFQKTRIDVVDAVIKAYYLVLINREKLVATESNMERLETLLDETQAMYQAGFAEEIDVKRIRVNYNNLDAAKKTLERAIEISEYLLKYQMGMPVADPIRVVGDLKGVEDILKQKPALEGFDYHDRVEYSILKTNEALQELDIKNNKVQYLPNLYAIGRMGWNTYTNNSNNYFNFSDRWLNYGLVGLQLEVPIFDGFLKSYRIQQSRIELDKVKNNFSLLENSINTQILQSNDGLKASLDRLDVQKQNVELAQDVYDVTKTKFQEGVGSNIELINADDAFITAQVDYYDALYNAILSKIALEKSLGKLDYKN